MRYSGIFAERNYRIERHTFCTKLESYVFENFKKFTFGYTCFSQSKSFFDRFFRNFASPFYILYLRRAFYRAQSGKFFRTVKGGFETYKKYQIVVYMTILSSTVLCATVAFLLDHFGIIALKGGIAFSVACVTSVVYANIILIIVSV